MRRTENETTPSLSWLTGKRVAFVGDSITADLKSNYVTLTVDLLADVTNVRSMTIINSGIDSSSVPDALDRLPDLLLEYNPDIYVIFLGVNDSKIFRSINQPLISPKMFEECYARLLDGIDHGAVQSKILVTPPPLLYEEIRTGEILKDYWYWQPDLYIEYVNIVKRLAKRPGCELADAYASFEATGEGLSGLFFEDGVHPNIYGHRLIAKSVFDALSRLPSATQRKNE